MRILDHLEMYRLDYDGTSVEDLVALGPPSTILCSKGFWVIIQHTIFFLSNNLLFFKIYTKTGGVLEVYPGVNTIIKKGDIIARIKNIFGNVVDEYYAPCSGVVSTQDMIEAGECYIFTLNFSQVIGRSSNPVAMSGDRIVHLGVIKKKSESLPKEAKENY